MKTWNFALFIVIVILLCIVQTFLNTGMETLVHESYTHIKSMALLKAFITVLFSFLAGISLFFENLLVKTKEYLNKRILLFFVILAVLSLNKVLIIALGIPISNAFILALLITNDFSSIIFGFSSGILLCFMRSKKPIAND